ncbi:MAG: HAD family phosphatase [Ruminococcaceae bacterium]|nr:HAD family phosphatase [Oscillospiraceae bacterium]
MQHLAYIFDFDGTLVDSMPYVAMGVKRFLDNRGVKYPKNIMEIVTPLGYPASAAYYNEHFGLSVTGEEYFDEVQNLIFPYYQNEIPLKKGAYEYLKTLKARGASLSVLTASPLRLVKPCFERLGILDWFDQLWCCDDFGRIKSDPEIYLEAAKRLSVEPTDIAFFDDSFHSLAAAKKAGLYTVGIYDEVAKAFVNDVKASSNVYHENFLSAKDI